MYGNPEVTSGGNALKFYASVRLEVRRKQTIEGAKGENVGIRVKAKVRIVGSSCHDAMLSYLQTSSEGIPGAMERQSE